MRLLLGAALIAAAILFQCGHADYWFHIGTSFYNNPTNSLSNGSCCNTSCLDHSMAAQCCTEDSCNLATRICIREADQPHTPEGECTRGEFTYPYLPDVVNSRSMIPVRGPLINAEIQLYIRISHIPEGNQLDFALPLSNPVIDEFYHDGSVAAINVIIPLTGEHGTAQIIVQMFYRCAINFFGSSCATYCQERDDDRGHYSCASDGSRQCLNGYTDPTTNCTKPEEEDRAEAGQDSQNPRNRTKTENMTSCVQNNDVMMTRSISESTEKIEVLSVADIIVIVNSGVLDVLLLVGVVLLAVTIARMTHKHRRLSLGDKSTVLQNGNGHTVLQNGNGHAIQKQQHCNKNLVISRSREDTLENAPGLVDSTYERITNYVI